MITDINIPTFEDKILVLPTKHNPFLSEKYNVNTLSPTSL